MQRIFGNLTTLGYVLLVGCASLFYWSSLYAATISINTQDLGNIIGLEPELCNVQTQATEASCTSGPAIGTFGGVAQATASANSVMGELRATSSHTTDDGTLIATAQVAVTEIFQVSGTGSITVSMRVTGETSVFGNGWQVQASISRAGIVNDVDFFLNQNTELGNGIYNLIESDIYNVVDGQEIELTFSLLTQIQGGTSGSHDYGNTAQFIIVPDGGVTLTPSDPNFLSNPSFELSNDDDDDGIPNSGDNCPIDYNPTQGNIDDDEFGNSCDNCPGITNPDQADGDSEGVGDVCDVDTNADTDGDGVLDEVDVCEGTDLNSPYPPEFGTRPNRYWSNSSGQFVKSKGGTASYTLVDTSGCSAGQILDLLELGKGHVRFGITKSVIQSWIAQYGRE